jgi:two-component system LytT family response regulator
VKILIVDDEPLALKRIEKIVGELDYSNITSTTNPLEALDILKGDDFNLVISDIEMPEMSGVEFAEEALAISPKIYIVFQTAYEEYAIDAFKIGAIDYILKPYSKNELQRALDRATQFLSLERRERIISKNGDEFYLLKLEDIIYIKAELSEIMIRTESGFSYYSKKISQVESMLKPFNFMRVHRSYIVNLDKIREFETTVQSRLRFSFEAIPEKVESSRDGAKLFRERFK